MISGLSIPDYVNIVGHYNKLQHGPTIDPRILERGYTEAQLEALRDKLGKSTTKISSLNIRFEKPIEEFNYPLFGYIMTLYNQYDKGVLPFKGSLADQPAQIIEIFNTIESVQLEHRQREISQQEKELKRKNRPNGRR